MKRIILGAIAAIMMVGGMIGILAVSSSPVYAAKTLETNILDSSKLDNEGGGIFYLINLVLNILTYGVGVLGVVGLVWVGIMYITAGDNEGKIVEAKKRIFEIVLGMAVWIFLRLIAQFLIPGLKW